MSHTDQAGPDTAGHDTESTPERTHAELVELARQYLQEQGYGVREAQTERRPNATMLTVGDGPRKLLAVIWNDAPSPATLLEHAARAAAADRRFLVIVGSDEVAETIQEILQVPFDSRVARGVVLYERETPTTLPTGDVVVHDADEIQTRWCMRPEGTIELHVIDADGDRQEILTNTAELDADWCRWRPTNDDEAVGQVVDPNDNPITDEVPLDDLEDWTVLPEPIVPEAIAYRATVLVPDGDGLTPYESELVRLGAAVVEEFQATLDEIIARESANADDTDEGGDD